MKKVFLLSFIVITSFLQLAAQEEAIEGSFEQSFEKEYSKRIQKEYLNGVYIPKDLADSFVQLSKLTDNASEQKFKNAPEEFAAKKLHFSLGRWMIYNWQFYEGSRLSHYFRQMGLTHPDDMAQFIIVTYHRHLNKKPLNPKPLIEEFVNNRKSLIQNRLKKGEVIHEETRKVDPDTSRR